MKDMQDFFKTIRENAGINLSSIVPKQQKSHSKVEKGITDTAAGILSFVTRYLIMATSNLFKLKSQT